MHRKQQECTSHSNLYKEILFQFFETDCFYMSRYWGIDKNQ